MRFLSIFFIAITVFLFVCHTVLALEMESNEYKIQILEENPSDSIPDVKDKPIEFNKKVSLLDTQGYIILSDDQKRYTKPVIFSISNTTVDFGELKPSSDIQHSTETNISYEGQFGYQLVTQVQRPFQTFGGNTLSPTFCSQKTPCTFETAQKWEDKIYGVGYNVQGDDTTKDFLNSDYFRPLSHDATNDIPIFNDSTQEQRINTYNFKIKTPSQQAEGSYFTIVDLIAIPRL